ncbi:MAG: CoA pyrophosphatase [Verrucomicrobia bacterium]|nr:CoA pyrophosphatase [Verrucomicrobiota bacterium]
MNNQISNIRTALSKADSELLDLGTKPQAAVAAIIRADSAGLEILFIRRSHRQGDPWSGHLAFPGGRLEKEDASPREAAERETLEEIGLPLMNTEYLGPLTSLTGLTLPVSVSAFAYFIRETPDFIFSQEVQSAFWTSFSDLTDPKKRTSYELRSPTGSQSFEAIDVLGPNAPVLWGITYRFTQQLIDFT